MRAALALLLIATAVTFAADPLMGTWKLNEAKSKFGPGSTKNTTYKPVNGRTNSTTAMKDGKVVMTDTITVAKDGKSRVVTLTGRDASGKKFTGKTYYDKQ